LGRTAHRKPRQHTKNFSSAKTKHHPNLTTENYLTQRENVPIFQPNRSFCVLDYAELNNKKRGDSSMF
jgi:hypothetical protein